MNSVRFWMLDVGYPRILGEFAFHGLRSLGGWDGAQLGDRREIIRGGSAACGAAIAKRAAGVGC